MGVEVVQEEKERGPGALAQERDPQLRDLVRPPTLQRIREEGLNTRDVAGGRLVGGSAVRACRRNQERDGEKEDDLALHVLPRLPTRRAALGVSLLTPDA